MSPLEKEQHDHYKVILLETLGNARLDDSYDYIVSHINSTNSPWIKRAGCHALRKYDHHHVISDKSLLIFVNSLTRVKYEYNPVFQMTLKVLILSSLTPIK